MGRETVWKVLSLNEVLVLRLYWFFRTSLVFKLLCIYVFYIGFGLVLGSFSY